MEPFAAKRQPASVDRMRLLRPHGSTGRAREEIRRTPGRLSPSQGRNTEGRAGSGGVCATTGQSTVRATDGPHCLAGPGPPGSAEETRAGSSPTRRPPTGAVPKLTMRLDASHPASHPSQKVDPEPRASDDAPMRCRVLRPLTGVHLSRSFLLGGDPSTRAPGCAS